jgi:hypothetical protein
MENAASAAGSGPDSSFMEQAVRFLAAYLTGQIASKKKHLLTFNTRYSAFFKLLYLLMILNAS